MPRGAETKSADTDKQDRKAAHSAGVSTKEAESHAWAAVTRKRNAEHRADA